MWFTEDPVAPCAVFLAAGLFVLLVARPGNPWRTAFLGGLLIVCGLLAFVVDALVVTPRETIELRIRQLCDDFRHRRAGTIDYFSNTAPELKVAVASAMLLVTVESEPSLTDFQIRFTNQGSRATSHFRANAVISVKGHGNVGHQPSRFLLTWIREGNEWKIVKVQRLHPVQDRELGLLEQIPG
jgi:hypothetical protein